MAGLYEKYGFNPDPALIAEAVSAIASKVGGDVPVKVYMDCFAAMDVTTLHSQDTPASVLKLVRKVNRLAEEYPAYPVPASICVYPNLANVVRENKTSGSLAVTAVSSCFPTAQSFLEVKVRECELAVLNGADEIDIVLPLNSFLADDYGKAGAEIKAMREVVDKAGASVGRDITLKVILESGLLATPERIADASFLAMENGADFIKTSTGKSEVSATPEAAYVMCSCIKAYYARTGRKVGFKAAGGISTAQDAVLYHSIVSTVLGEEFLGKEYFRLGVSRLANSLMSAVEGSEVKYF